MKTIIASILLTLSVSAFAERPAYDNVPRFRFYTELDKKENVDATMQKCKADLSTEQNRLNQLSVKILKVDACESTCTEFTASSTTYCTVTGFIYFLH